MSAEIIGKLKQFHHQTLINCKAPMPDLCLPKKTPLTKMAEFYQEGLT